MVPRDIAFPVLDTALTTAQVVYIPAQKSDEFPSFSAPLLNVRDSHVTAPFFGPNAWVALVQPVSGGGIPPGLPAIQVKVTFKEGGAFDFHNRFERIKERLEQVVEVSRESARGSANVDMSTVHLEELPAYSAPASEAPGARPAYDAPPSTSQHTRVASETGPEFMEPPPGYEEVQQQSVANELEERLRRTT